jgi:UDP-N-acetylglucosamine--N-acetylmuramyl-(pentapeptide) pyrophosphoryl-undecaprenol N-acetylglucosamine transferase
MRILFYAVNGLGLGHVTRLLAMAREVRRLSKKADILFLTSSESNVVYREGFPSVKVPSKNAACRAGMEPPLHISILHQTAFSVFSSFAPDITVVDTFPHGFAHELDQVLRWEKGRFVYVCRQRRDDKLESEYLHSLMSRYDLILVPHEKNEPGVLIPKGLRSFHSGPVLVRNRAELWPKERVLSTFALPHDKKRILVNLGGGGQDHWEKIIASIVGQLKNCGNIHIVIAQGGLAPVREFAGCTVLNDYYPVCELYNGFDAIIAGCGYNTVNESLFFRLPGIFIPFEREVDDQFRRAKSVEQAGLGFCLEYGDIKRLSSKLEELLEPGRHSAIMEGLRKFRIRNNAAKAAKAIVKLGKVRR